MPIHVFFLIWPRDPHMEKNKRASMPICVLFLIWPRETNLYPKASQKLKFTSICSDDRGGFVTPSDHCALCSSKLILEVTHVEDAKQSLVVPKNVPQITDFFSECPLFLWPLCFFEATLGGYKCRGCLVIQLCQEIVLQMSWFLFQTILDFFDHCSALCLFRLILDVINYKGRGTRYQIVTVFFQVCP